MELLKTLKALAVDLELLAIEIPSTYAEELSKVCWKLLETVREGK